MSVLKGKPVEKPLISVIVPVFNVEQWVEIALQSICLQDYNNLEILVINDGSTDSSRDLCAEIARKDDRIVIIDQNNQGLSAARNTGIDNAQGEYLVFVDSDDVLQCNHISLLYESVIREGVKIACTVMTQFDGEFACKASTPSKCQIYRSEDAVKEMFYQGAFDSCAQAKIYAIDLWRDVRFPVGYLHEDLPTTYKVFLNTDSVAFFNSETYGYRFNPNGINHSITDDRKVKTLDLLDDASAILAVSHPRLLASLRCLKVSYSLHCLLNAEIGSISKESENKLKKTVLINRKETLKDRNARKKTKAALLISYFGWHFLHWLFRLHID